MQSTALRDLVEQLQKLVAGSQRTEEVKRSGPSAPGSAPLKRLSTPAMADNFASV
jgi:hypothetical protein